MKIPKECKKLLEKNYMPLFHPYLPYRVLYLITYDNEFQPNITIISFAKVINDKIYIADIALLKSRLNIQENSKCAILVYENKKYVPTKLKERILNPILNLFVFIGVSPISRKFLSFLISLYSLFKDFLRPTEYEIKEGKQKGYLIFGEAKIMKSGKIYNEMKEFFKTLIKKEIHLESVIEIRPYQIIELWK